MKRLAPPAWVLFLSISSFLMVGCGELNKNPEQGNYTIGFVGRGENTAYEALLEKSAKRFAREVEHIYGDIEVLWASPDRSGGVNQAQIIQRFIEQEVDGIALSCGDLSAVEAINTAMNANIPVITFERDAPDSARITYLGCEEAFYGFFMAQSIFSALQGEGRFVALTGESEAQRQRLEGLELELRSYSGVELLEVMNCQSIDDAPRLMREANNRYEKIGAWALLNDWPIRTNEGRAVLESLPGYKAAVSLGDPETWSHLESGLVDALIVPGRQDWGAASVSILLDIITTDKPFPNHTGIKPISITSEGLERYRAHWSNWFRGVERVDG